MAEQLSIGDIVTLRGGSGPTMVVGEFVPPAEVRLYWFNLNSQYAYEIQDCFLPIGVLDKVEVTP